MAAFHPNQTLAVTKFLRLDVRAIQKALSYRTISCFILVDGPAALPKSADFPPPP